MSSLGDKRECIGIIAEIEGTINSIEQKIADLDIFSSEIIEVSQTIEQANLNFAVETSVIAVTPVQSVS